MHKPDRHPGSVGRVWVFAGVCLLTIVALLAIVGHLDGPGLDHGDKVASVFGALVSTVVALATVGVWALRRRPGPGLPDAGELARARDSLAARVQAVCRAEFPTTDPGAADRLAVPFDTAAGHLMDRWENIQDSGRPEALALRGTSATVAERYRSIDSGRLVVLGDTGSGKTVLAHQLARGLLERRAAGQWHRVPVVVPAAHWIPATMDLRAWVCAAVAARWSPLAAPAGDGRSLIEVLWDEQAILPILDGFDELPAALRVAALERIHATAGPYVLTSRPAAFEQALAGWELHLARAPVVVLGDPPFTAVADYLRRGAGGADTPASPWDPVIDRMVASAPAGAGREPATARFRTGAGPARSAPRPAAPDPTVPDPTAATLYTVLSRPLMAALARSVYQRRSSDPAALLELSGPGAVERHLLDRFVPAAYQRERGGAGGTADDPSVHRAVAALSFLAGRLARRHSTQLAWWRLAALLSTGERLLALSTVGAALIGLGWAAAVLLIGLGLGARTLLAGGLPDLSGLRLLVEAAAVAALLAGGQMLLLIPVVVGLRRGALEFSQRQVRLRHNVGRLTRRFARNAARGLAACAGLMFVAANLGAALGLACRGFGYGLAVGTARAAAAGAAIGLQLGLLALLASLASTPDDVFDLRVDLTEAITPAALLRSERRIAIARTVALVPVLGVVTLAGYALLRVLHAPDAGALTAVGWVGLAGIAPLWLLACTAWGHFVVARIWFALRRRTPVRLMAFLAEAHARDVLRQVGAEYEFRHAELRDVLAGRQAPGGPALEPATGPASPGDPAGDAGAAGAGGPPGGPRRRPGRRAAAIVVAGALLVNTAVTATVLVRAWPRPSCAPGTALACVTWHAIAINDVAFSPDGTVLATASCDGRVRLWDPRTGRSTGRSFHSHHTCVNHVAFSADGRSVISTSYDRYLRTWWPGSGRSTSVATTVGGPDALSRDGTRIAIVTGSRLSVRRADSDVAISDGLEASWGTITTVAFSADGRTVLGLLGLGGGADRGAVVPVGVDLWHSAGRTPGRRFLPGRPTAAALSPDGRLVAVAGSQDLTIYDAVTLRALGSTRQLPEGAITLMEFSPDATALLVASRVGEMRLLDTASLDPVEMALSGHSGPVVAAAFSPDGRLLATAGQDLALRLWRTEA